MPYNPKSKNNLIPGVRKGMRGERRKITTTVLPESQEWLKAQGAMGEAIDKLIRFWKESQADDHT